MASGLFKGYWSKSDADSEWYGSASFVFAVSLSLSPPLIYALQLLSELKTHLHILCIVL